MTFTELGLNDQIIKAVAALGFETPTPVQQVAIPAILNSTGDIVALAQTGTGKTAAFGLPLLSGLIPEMGGVQALVLCPTRELCLQISRDFEQYGKYLHKFNVLAVYGGSSIENQIRELKRGVDVVVATPGRLIDLMNRKAMKLDKIHTVVLDEADEMLNMGFQEDIDMILSSTPDSRRTLLFSATMPSSVERIARKYMHEPEVIQVGERNSGATTVEHIYYGVKEKDRYQALRRLLDFHPEIFGLVFCRTRNETQTVADKLQMDGYNALPLHGDMSQAMRDSTMKKFRDRTLQVLVATDVAARGIDVDSISHVINYNLPDDIENYTHRSGRTGRAGKKGVSMAIVNQRETGKIRDIQRQMKVNFVKGRIPDADQIVEKQIARFTERLTHDKVDIRQVERYMTNALKMVASIEKEELLARVIAVEFEQFSAHYRYAEDINVDTASRDRGRDSDRDRGRSERGRERGDRDRVGGRGDRDNSSGSSRFIPDGGGSDKLNRNIDGSGITYSISAGEDNNMNKGAVVRLICSAAGITAKDIGRIDVHPKISYFQVSANVAQYIDRIVNQRMKYGSEQVVVNTAEAPRDTRWDWKKKKNSGSKGGGNSRGSSGGGSKSSGNSGGGRQNRKRY